MTEFGAGLNIALVILGERLGLYKAMAEAGPMTSDELAQKLGCAERYVREWLNAQAAGGYVGSHLGERVASAASRVRGTAPYPALRPRVSFSSAKVLRF